MTTAFRAVAASLTLSLSLGVGVAVAADPTSAPNTLGATVSGYVILDESPTVLVRNEGSVLTTFTATVPDGWAFEPVSMLLEPGESGRFTLSGTGDAGNMVILGRSTGLIASGGDTSAIQFGSIALMQTRPFDPSRYYGTALLVALILTGTGLVLRRTKPWQYRLTRA